MNILITGGAGFIGSNLVKFLNDKGITPIIYDPNFLKYWQNLSGLKFKHIDSYELEQYSRWKYICVHLGASVDTLEPMSETLWNNNFGTTKYLEGLSWEKFIYASSASVYGAEEKDFRETNNGQKALNAYAFTKQQIDAYFESEKFEAIGLRFFNVYGSNEGHKGKMASVIHKFLKQPNKDKFQLFKSNRPEIAHGEQKRDFVYVEDVCEVIWFMINQKVPYGVYNVGSGMATSFNEVVEAINPKAEIEYIDMPEELTNQYQYYTCADLTKLRSVGFNKEFRDIKCGIRNINYYGL